jgi:hypothetical protein
MILTRKDFQQVEHLEHLASKARQRLLGPLTQAEVDYAAEELAHYQLDICKIYTSYS